MALSQQDLANSMSRKLKALLLICLCIPVTLLVLASYAGLLKESSEQERVGKKKKEEKKRAEDRVRCSTHLAGKKGVKWLYSPATTC